MPRPQDSGPVERSILYWIRLYIARFFYTTNSQIRRLSSLRSRRLEVTGARKEERTGRARETREGSESTPSRVSLAFFLAPIFSKRLLQRLANPTQKYQKKTTHTLHMESVYQNISFWWANWLGSKICFVIRVYGAVLSCVCGFFKRKIFSAYSKYKNVLL